MLGRDTADTKKEPHQPSKEKHNVSDKKYTGWD